VRRDSRNTASEHWHPITIRRDENAIARLAPSHARRASRAAVACPQRDSSATCGAARWPRLATSGDGLELGDGCGGRGDQRGELLRTVGIEPVEKRGAV
jgi:hypothetical protein